MHTLGKPPARCHAQCADSGPTALISRVLQSGRVSSRNRAGKRASFAVPAVVGGTVRSSRLASDGRSTRRRQPLILPSSESATLVLVPWHRGKCSVEDATGCASVGNAAGIELDGGASGQRRYPSSDGLRSPRRHGVPGLRARAPFPQLLPQSRREREQHRGTCRDAARTYREGVGRLGGT